MSVDVVVVGPIIQDLTLAVDEVPPVGGSVQAARMREAVGGGGTNTAAACVRLGATAALVGVVGDDKLGKRMRKQLKRAGIDVRLVQRRPGQATGRVVHLVEPGGQHRIVELPAASEGLAMDKAGLISALDPGGWLLLSTAMPVAPLIEAAEIARAVGARVALHLAGPPETGEALLRFADLVHLDASESQALTGTVVSDVTSAAVVARWLQVRGPDVVAVAAGSAGDLLRVHVDDLLVPRPEMDAVDPTGGGDAFIATLLVRLTAGDDPARAAAVASAAAAHTVARFGGTPRFDLAELERTVRAEA